MDLKKYGIIGAGALGVGAIVLISVVAGAVSLGFTGIIIATLAYIIGLVNMGTAQAVFIWFALIGGVLGLLRALIAGLFMGA